MSKKQRMNGDVTTACCVIISPRKVILPEDAPKELYALCAHKLARPGLELGLQLGQRFTVTTQIMVKSQDYGAECRRCPWASIGGGRGVGEHGAS